MKAIAYARFSSNNQREESIDAQLRAIKEYAKKNDMNIIKVYTDEAEAKLQDVRVRNFEWANEKNTGKFLNHYKKLLLSKDPIDQRKVIECFVDKIVIYPDEIESSFKIDDLSSPNMDGDKIGGGGALIILSFLKTKKDLFNTK